MTIGFWIMLAVDALIVRYLYVRVKHDEESLT